MRRWLESVRFSTTRCPSPDAERLLVYRSEGEPLKVMMLLASDLSDTITVNQIVPNEKYSKSG
ncbi:hypothetical protein [Rhodopirellula baltica]